jgi:hypothetical protein
MPTARYGDASHAFIVALDGALQASKPLPVKVPGDTAETAIAAEIGTSALTGTMFLAAVAARPSTFAGAGSPSATFCRSVAAAGGAPINNRVRTAAVAPIRGTETIARRDLMVHLGGH